MRPEARLANRQAALKEGKAKKAELEKKKKADKAKLAAQGGKKGPIASKQGSKGAAPKVAATSR